MGYLSRLKLEKKLKKKSLPEQRYVLSSNSKTGVSMNLPVMNCRPTKRCAKSCYACHGPISWEASARRSLIVDKMLRKGEIGNLVWECMRYKDVRLCGSGDLTTAHVPALTQLARWVPATHFWGFTRRREVAEALYRKHKNLSMILTIDATSPDKVLKGYKGPLAFGPRRPEDPVPSDRRIVVVFPEHVGGRTTKGIPDHPKDCPATRGFGHDLACPRCQRCHHPKIGG